MNIAIDTNTLIMLIPVLALQIIFSIFCWVKICNGTVKYLPKWFWAILCVNTLGAIIFLIIGRGDE